MLSLITGPTVEPLTVAEVRRHLMLGDTAGEPTPVAPTVALASPAVAGNCDNGAWRIGVTFVTADGETALGSLSASVTVVDKAVNGKITVTGIPLGGTAVTARKIYALSPGATVAKYAQTISNNTAETLTFNVAASSLGADAPSVDTTVDPQLTLLIQMARDRAEVATGRALLTQTWDYYLDGFPNDVFVEIPKPPLVSVTHLKYKDTAGTLQTWAATNYIVETPAGPRCQRGRVGLGSSVVWPSTYGQLADIVIRFIAGNTTAANVPPLLKAAMLQDIGTLYAQRESVVVGTIASELPMSALAIYRSFRTRPRQWVGA